MAGATVSSAIATSAMTRPALPRLRRSTSSALQAARNRAAAILSICKFCADTIAEALNNEVGIATPGPKLENEVRRLQMKVGDRWLRKLDRWRGKQANPPNRSEAIRMLVERAIDAECPTSRRRSLEHGESALGCGHSRRRMAALRRARSIHDGAAGRTIPSLMTADHAPMRS
jgi:hypothetical protein